VVHGAHLSGKEGWVLNRYLTPNQPSAMVLDRVRQDYDVLAAKYEDLKKSFDELRHRKMRPMPIFPRTIKDRDQLSAAYEALKKESSEFLKLKSATSR
jgi:SH3 domain protein